MRVRLPNPLAALDDRALLSRFAGDRDQHSFEQLVKRHGRLVFGVCRRLTGNDADAEDAFQAVFLVLARDPRRAAEASSVGGWLFGVARRVGLAARRHELRRERREQAAPPRAADAPTGEFDDLLRVLDEELAALPDDLRAALVACFLEERTQDDAARELGWSLSTLRRRLDRGKELLRARLTRRGVALGAGLLAVGLGGSAPAAPALAAPSPTALALAAEVMRRGVGPKLLAALVGVALAVGGAAFGLARAPADAPEPPPAPTPVAPAPRPAGAKAWATVSGRVVFPKDRDAPLPQPVALDAMKDADIWKPDGLLCDHRILVGPDRGIGNAVVFLRPDSDDRAAAFPPDRVHPDLAKPKPVQHTVVADVRGQFVPRVTVARTGDTVLFDNRLPVPTNVRHEALTGANREFNVLIGKGMSHATKPLAATHLPDRYDSTIYPWMAGYIWAFDHPYVAVTDASGAFALPQAPAGRWRLVVWHEAAGWLGGPAGRLGTTLTVPETGPHDLGPLTFDSGNWPK